MAQVEAGGPFSSFPGVDRTLSILEGSGMMLDIEDRRPVTLTEASAPYSFPADDTTHAELIDGPVTDLNVMTRRGRYGHTVTRYEIAGTGDFVPGGSPSVLFCHAKDLRIRGEGFEAELGMFDAAVFGEDIGNGLQVEGSGRLFLIEIERMA
jgi:environmental stress-induced protein Ves